jgi:hypothetical protein
MGSFLMVGRLPDHVERDDAAAYLSGATDTALTSDAQAALLQAWDAAPDEMAYFDALNEASTSAFLNHAAKLEGLKDSNEALTRSRWRHLPYWIESFWLPVHTDTATAPWRAVQELDRDDEYYVEFANFGSDGTAYVFIDRETTRHEPFSSGIAERGWGWRTEFTLVAPN